MKYLYLILTSSILLTGCGGSDSSDDEGDNLTTIKEEPTLSGKFKDSSTSGLDYVIGDYHGKTDINGSFKHFSKADNIIFSVGGVVLGSATVADVLTPIDLIDKGSSENISVQNIVRLLLALDSDGDASNGINITAEVAEKARDWQQLDFTSDSDDFDAEVTDKITKTLDLPSTRDAKEHIESTYKCMYSSLWVGEYGGTEVDNGKFFSHTDIETGIRSFSTHSLKYPEIQFQTYNDAITYLNEMAVFSGESSTGSNFSGQYDSINSASGTWQFENSQPGTLSAKRFNLDLTYTHRFTIKLLDDEEEGYDDSTAYYVSVDVNDAGEYKYGIHSYNEKLSDDSENGPQAQVEKRIVEYYYGSGELINDELTIKLSDINKSITVITDAQFSTTTASLLNSSGRTINNGAVSYCHFK